MQPCRLLVLPAVALALLAASGVDSDARGGGEQAREPRVVFLTEGPGCSSSFTALLCNGFTWAVRRTGVTGRVITPTAREDLVDTLDLLARQRYDLVVMFGFQYPPALAKAARHRPEARFAIVDTSHDQVDPRAHNVQGVLLRTSEAAYLAGWLAGRMERRRPGRDVLGIVGGSKIPSVDDFVLGFSAGARRASPGITVLVGYANDFADTSKCTAIARNHVAKGAGILFNVAGECGLGTLDVAKEARVWGIGVDTDQSFLGPHVLTSVLKRFNVAFLTLLRQAKARKIPTGGDTVLTLREGAVGLGRISRKVPAPLRAELDRLRRRIVSGEIRVPGTIPDPR